MRSLAVLILLSALAPLPASAGKPLDPAAASVLADFVRPTTVPYPDSNPYSKAKVELGRKLFFDTALSGDGTRSCATCHAPVSGWQDGVARHEALDGTMLGRRTPSAQDGAWGELFFWDGRAASLEEQALGPVQSVLEMNQTLDGMVRTLEAKPEYSGLFASRLPREPEDHARHGRQGHRHVRAQSGIGRHAVRPLGCRRPQGHQPGGEARLRRLHRAGGVRLLPLRLAVHRPCVPRHRPAGRRPRPGRHHQGSGTEPRVQDADAAQRRRPGALHA